MLDSEAHWKTSQQWNVPAMCQGLKQPQPSNVGPLRVPYHMSHDQNMSRLSIRGFYRNHIGSSLNGYQALYKEI